MLRTLRSGLAPDLEAKGTVSGKNRLRHSHSSKWPPSAKPIAIVELKTESCGRLLALVKLAPAGPPGPLDRELYRRGPRPQWRWSQGRPVQAPKFTLAPVAIVSAAPSVFGDGAATDSEKTLRKRWPDLSLSLRAGAVPALP
ncbi:MAG: hypothetical protein WDM87_00440 [Terracidiphilus sp.]